ncbi:hypothetical protein [Methanosarcina sp. WWM596]|nr:hypothetical protein [Methanosarcina sp. WWM596]
MELDTAVISMDGTVDYRIFTADDEFGDNTSHIYMKKRKTPESLAQGI